MVRRTGPEDDWSLGINEIRALRPDWPEQLVQDYFNKGTGRGEANTTSTKGGGAALTLPKEGVNLPFKSLLAGDNITFDEDDFTLTINADGGTGPGGDCYCFLVPDQDCETLLADCEALDQFYQQYGAGAPAYYLSRNYTEDLIGGFSGEVTNLIEGGPNGDAFNMLEIAPGDDIDLDTCDKFVLRWPGGFAPPRITVRDVGSLNSMTMGVLIRNRELYGDTGKALWGGQTGADSSIRYVVGWNPTTRFFNVVDGSSGSLDPDDRVTLSVTGPSGYDPDREDAWVALFVQILRTSNSITMNVAWRDDGGYGFATDSSTTSDGGGNLSTRPWWTIENATDNTFSWGITSTADAISAIMLWTGLYASLPSREYIERLYYEARRNSTTFDCDEDADGLPPVLSGSVPRYNQDSETWELSPPLPGANESGLYLVSNQTEPFFSEWQKLPIVGGTTGQHLTKVSDAEYDVAWTQRDVKAFDQIEDPAVSETVYPGDLWIQGGIG